MISSWAGPSSAEPENGPVCVPSAEGERVVEHGRRGEHAGDEEDLGAERAAQEHSGAAGGCRALGGEPLELRAHALRG